MNLIDIDVRLKELKEERAKLVQEWREFNFKHRDKMREIRKGIDDLLRARRRFKNATWGQCYGMQYKPSKQERIEAIEKELAILKSEL